jgi:opacity protein-like surface antigen
MQQRITAIGAAAALLLSGAAFAQSTPAPGIPGWTLGVDVGQSKGPGSGDINGSFGAQGATGTSVDDKDTAWGLNLGYRFHRNWGLEGGYRDFGKYGYSTSTPPGTISGEYKAQAWSLAGVGYLPLGDSAFSLYGKLGVARTDVDRNVNSAPPGMAVGSTSANKTGLMGGLGLQYDFSNRWFAKAGWDRYTRVGNESTGKADLDVLSAGVGIRF